MVDALSQGRTFDIWEADGLNSAATPVLASHAGALTRRALEVQATGIVHLSARNRSRAASSPYGPAPNSALTLASCGLSRRLTR
jgi:hypothetical protein